MVRQVEQGIELRDVIVGEPRPLRVEEAREHQVVLQHPATAAPAQAFVSPRVPGHSWRAPAHTARLTIIVLMFPIARVGLRPFGQTSTQFMIEWQRNSRYGSSRLSSRSFRSRSRLSAMK